MKKIFAVQVCMLFIGLCSSQTISLSPIGQLDDILSEPSGLEVIYNTSNGHFEYWTHNDYEYPESIYSFRLDDIMTITRELDVTESYIDWEDMTSDDSGHVYLGDFGNWVEANDLQIVKIPNPNSFNGAAPSVEIIKYVYPFPGVTDTEAMFHFDGSLYIFSKSVSSGINATLDENHTYCFRIPDSPHPQENSYTAEFVGSFEVVLPGDIPNRFKVTAADISPDKKKMVLQTYERIWVFSCFDGPDFFNGTYTKISIPYRQYEGICFLNNHEVVICKEGNSDDPNNNPKIFYLDISSWIDGSCIVCEKTINGDFSDPNLAWSLFEYGNGSATLDMTGNDAIIDIQTLGTSQWHINLRHKSLVLENGKSYRVTYKAYAEDNRPISIIINNAAGSTGYYYKSQMITSFPTYYSHDFTMNESTNYNSYFSINVGNYFAHKVYLDDISIVELDCICPQNKSFFAELNTEEHFEAANEIHGYNLINSNNIIYDAGNSIELHPGFETSLGAQFEAYVDGCDGN